jgi:hypothetical protein
MFTLTFMRAVAVAAVVLGQVFHIQQYLAEQVEVTAFSVTEKKCALITQRFHTLSEPVVLVVSRI